MRNTTVTNRRDGKERPACGCNRLERGRLDAQSHDFRSRARAVRPRPRPKPETTSKTDPREFFDRLRREACHRASASRVAPGGFKYDSPATGTCRRPVSARTASDTAVPSAVSGPSCAFRRQPSAPAATDCPIVPPGRGVTPLLLTPDDTVKLSNSPPSLNAATQDRGDRDRTGKLCLPRHSLRRSSPPGPGDAPRGLDRGSRTHRGRRHLTAAASSGGRSGTSVFCSSERNSTHPTVRSNSAGENASDSRS